MSEENALGFLQKISEDDDLHARGNDGDWVELAKSAGLECTAEELNAAAGALMDEATDDAPLSDDELDAVAGGGRYSVRTVGSRRMRFTNTASFRGFNVNVGRLGGFDRFKLLGW